MKLVKLTVRRRESYEKMAGTLVGELQYSGMVGSVTIELDEELSAGVLKLVGESMARATAALADQMTAQLAPASADLFQSAA